MPGPVRLAVDSTFAGDYKVGRPLSEGVTRAVYAAEQISTGRVLALKIIAPDLVPDQESRDAFVAEVRAGSRIATEHVVDVRAAGIDKETGFPWLAMELLAGEDLAKTLADHKDAAPLPDWDDVVSQVLRGLAAVHTAGVVHGGLMPESIFLAVPGSGSERFRVEMLDLGLPKAARDFEKGQSARVEWQAPEQVEGKDALFATDVWAVGLLAFRMLTGTSYWRGAGAALSPEILSGPLDSASARAKAKSAATIPSAAFDAWFAKCVARQPSERWVDAANALDGAAEMLTEVSEVSADDIEEAPEPMRRPTGPPPLPPMVRAIVENPKPAIIAILVLTVVALGGGFGLGAILRPTKSMTGTADAPRARATVWARGDKEECQKACDKGDMVACHGLGLMHQYGLKVTRDDAKAATLFQKACDGGDGASCGSLAARYLNGEGVKEDRSKAASLYRKACDKGDAISCGDLAEMYENGNGVGKDPVQAKALYDKACKAGFAEVCK